MFLFGSVAYGASAKHEKGGWRYFEHGVSGVLLVVSMVNLVWSFVA